MQLQFHRASLLVYVVILVLYYFRLNQLKHEKEGEVDTPSQGEGESNMPSQGEGEGDKTELSPDSPPEGGEDPPAPLDDLHRNNFCHKLKGCIIYNTFIALIYYIY